MSANGCVSLGVCVGSICVWVNVSVCVHAQMWLCMSVEGVGVSVCVCVQMCVAMYECVGGDCECVGVYECMGVCAGCMEGLGNGVMTTSDHLQEAAMRGYCFPRLPGLPPQPRGGSAVSCPVHRVLGPLGLVPSSYFPGLSPWDLLRSPRRSLCREPVRCGRTA